MVPMLPRVSRLPEIASSTTDVGHDPGEARRRSASSDGQSVFGVGSTW